MKQDWQKDFEDYAKSHLPEVKALLKEWAAIPAPSHQEEQRARAVKTWLSAQGAEGVQIDEAGNVVYEMGCEKAERIAVFMAHMDVVFPDTDAFVVPTAVPSAGVTVMVFSSGASAMVITAIALRYSANRVKPMRAKDSDCARW